MHEGTIRFEHCYRLDLETSATVTQRRACWELWLESYTYGQSRDRIEYARRRLNAIADESQRPPELRLEGDRPPEQRQFYLVVPSPTSVHATPPPVATVYRPLATDAADAGSDAAPENAKTPPAEGCAASCRSAWQSCETGCSADAGPPKPAAGGKEKPAACACKDDYSKCMRGCFD
ncbi:MAG TPA: hypothetical protein VGK73_12700 [Polyangiaceae bacterium]